LTRIELVLRVIDLPNVAACPFAKRQDGLAERLSKFRQCVFHLWRTAGKDGARHDSIAFQCTQGPRKHLLRDPFDAPLLIGNGQGLIVNTGHYGAVSYHHGPVYGAQKAGADKMAADMAKELRPHNVAAVSIWMGGLDTERARAYLTTLPPESRPTAKRESPQFTGKVIAALYESDQRMRLSGRALIGAEIGAFLGVSDIDGSQPISHRYTLGGPPELHPSLLT
jgi:NAD(P)-dependent dehydrogenase (short-subunit alcohol dehydrogenase family)